jgi:hypothetical protein
MSPIFYYRTCFIIAVFLLFNDCVIDHNKQSVSSISAVSVPAADNAIPQHITGSPTPLKNMFGINAYEWNFLENHYEPNDRAHIYEDNMKVIRSFSAVRHYMNWNKLENTKGDYTFNPTNNGSWNYDVIYQRCKQDDILVVADLKNCPTWLVSTYPASSQDNENIPAPYNKPLADPATYADQARTAFQFAARYGYNTKVNKTLVKVDTRKRWSADVPNQVKIGMGLIKYIECDNERDKWWKGMDAQQTPEQYAANMSAFYDGHMGKLGPNAGVKSADPTMQVVMGGLASADVKFVSRMIAWCKKFRGTKPDGSINLCFDVINYHLYSNNGEILTHKRATTGVAPELSESGSIANAFVKLANNIPNHPEVWVTETGYDVNQQSYQKAVAIGNKSILATQADWILRTSLLYIRYGVKRVFFYQLFDDNPQGTSQYATSGLAEGTKRRPAADYILQTTKLMGNYIYKKTISINPLVDEYQHGAKTMYVLTMPTQTGKTSTYTLDLGKAIHANSYSLKIGADVMDKKQLSTVNGKLVVRVSETPVFVEGVR